MFARAFDSVPFGVKDPVFHHDLSFYIFTLPAWQYVYSFLYVALIVAYSDGVSLCTSCWVASSCAPAKRPRGGRR